MPFMLRGVRYGNNLSKIDSIYIVDDPWCMSSQGGLYWKSLDDWALFSKSAAEGVTSHSTYVSCVTA
jgi:hypothetical protein